MNPNHIKETCSCGASIDVTGSRYRKSDDPRNPRGAEEIVERWRAEHRHVVVTEFTDDRETNPYREEE